MERRDQSNGEGLVEVGEWWPFMKEFQISRMPTLNS